MRPSARPSSRTTPRTTPGATTRARRAVPAASHTGLSPAADPAPRPSGVPAFLNALNRIQRPSAPAKPIATASQASPQTASPPVFAVFGPEGSLLAIRQERQEVLCSVIGLMVKLGLIAVAGVSLMRLAGAYQQRMERQGEITAVLELETAKLAKARERFDTLFRIEGEQRLIREQSQWIAPNRLRVVWQNSNGFQSVQTAHAAQEMGSSHP